MIQADVTFRTGRRLKTIRYLGKLPNKAVLIRVKAVFFLGDWTTRQKR